MLKSISIGNFTLHMKKLLILLFVFNLYLTGNSQSYQIALLQYSGGGDWYANLETSLPNLINFTNKKLNTKINSEQAVVEVGSVDIYKYPFVHMTGHGNVVFSDQEVENLRKYLLSGGFLHIDDNYGMDQFIRPEMLRVFPELSWIELPFDHPIYSQTFEFKTGLPKVHQHDEFPPQGFGLIHEGRLVCFYSYQSDLGDGWESPGVHNDPEELRMEALKMGANILEYVLMGDGQKLK